jgi:hypothetical protein
VITTPLNVSSTRSPGPTATMTPFSTFALLYMTAIFLEMGERWRYPYFTLGTLLLTVLFVSTGITRITFLIFLGITTSHFLLVQFPDVANHVNIAIYCNLVMIFGIVYSLVRIRDFPADDDCFELMRPVLRGSLILVYVMAGFHKLNADFFDPTVSCAGKMLGDLARMARTTPLGIPTGLVFAAAILAVGHRLLSSSPLRRHLPVLAGVGVLGFGVLAAVIVLKPYPPDATALLVLAMAVVVTVWELVGGLLLAIPRLQAPVLAFSWTMHATLALIGFVDFGALALALLFTFVPQPYRDTLSDSLRLPIVRRPLTRVHVYFAINLAAGVISGLASGFAAALLFNLAALVFIWPLLSAAVAARPRPAWTGVSLSSRMTPKWMLVLPALLVLHGITSYVGLRTAGNFSMFSNLRTEGPLSNHFLLGGNPLKRWGYQEDVVHFIHIDDRRARIGYQYQALQGNRLPVVEFRKLIYRWTRAGATIPITFEYRGRVHSTEDIANDPAWRTDAWDWEMRLLDFRVIQPDGPNRCRW